MVNGSHVGMYIYDALLIRKKMTTLTVLSLEMRLRILFEIILFLRIEKVFKSNDIKVLVLGDITYRHGLFLQIAKSMVYLVLLRLI